MKKKAQRMMRTDRYIDRQLRIHDLKEPYYYTHPKHPRGRFKKQSAWDCGRPRCYLCGNPRRFSGWDCGLTYQERRELQKALYDLQDISCMYIDL